MSTSMWEKKAAKYKLKYLALKKQLGGFVPEPEFMTSRIDPKSDFYLSQKLFSYWISSSHNTYLPFNQNTNEVSVCYYNLQSMVYSGGCLEIDTYGIENDDVVITHLPTNPNKIKLEDILDVIMDALNNKIKKGIISGPFILTFDNKNLKKKSQQNIFWNTINNKLLSGAKVEEYFKLSGDPIPIQEIDEKFNLSEIPIKNMSNKILFRWGLNKKCNTTEDDVGHDLCPPSKEIADKFTKNENQWVHLTKGAKGFTSKFISDQNMSQSIDTPLISRLTQINLFSIMNTQRNIIRFYPNAFNIDSGNYDNMKYFRDGAQITALNLQKIGSARLLNDAVFIPPKSTYCSPKEILQGKCEHIHNIQAYRLKPLWLIGLLPYPDLYDLEIDLTEINLPDLKFQFTYGLNKKLFNKVLNKKIYISDVDVTVPFFVVEYSGFKNGIEIVWSETQLSNKIDFNLYKFNFKKEKDVFKKEKDTDYNKVDTHNCENDKLLNHSETKQFTIKYKWTKSTSKNNTEHLKLVQKYNDAILKTRTAFKHSTLDILGKFNLLNEYQNNLLKEISTKKSSIKIDLEEVKEEL
jgi:hypothetical protein